MSKADQMMEQILHRDNLRLAYKKVVSNKGSAGTDEMQVEGLKDYLKENWKSLERNLMEGSYKPKAVRRVEIPKADGTKRALGIPTVVDRMIQQAVSQTLSPIFEKKFSKNSYGFRPGKSAHQAIMKSKEYIQLGYEYIVDIDLAKFFDTVNHDKLMSLVSQEIRDKRVLHLIGKYLRAGIMVNGVVEPNREGTPQGSPLSPLLSNIMLNELDKELERRGHKFCRYADDCNIYVKSQRAAERVIEGVTKFIEKELKLKVNKEKSAAGKVTERKFLGFGYYQKKDGDIITRVHPKSIKKLREKVKKITSRKTSKRMETRIEELNQLLTGWINYFKIVDMKRNFEDIDGWIRRRLRMCYWKQWKTPKTRRKKLLWLGLKKDDAYSASYSRKGYWRIAGSPVLTQTLTNKYFMYLGYRSLSSRCSQYLLFS